MFAILFNCKHAPGQTVR